MKYSEKNIFLHAPQITKQKNKKKEKRKNHAVKWIFFFVNLLLESNPGFMVTFSRFFSNFLNIFVVREIRNVRMSR